MKQLFYIAAVLISTQLWLMPEIQAQAPNTEEIRKEYAGTISVQDLQTHLGTLASEAFEGRETGEEGQRLAAEYIAQHFESLNLPAIGDDNSYFQKIIYTAVNWDEIGLKVNGKSFKHLWDFYSFPGTNTNRPERKYKKPLFLGYGIDDPRYSDYKDVDVKGKLLLVYPGEPLTEDSISQVTGTRELSEWSTDWRLKLEAAKKNGAAAILLIDDQVQKNIAEQRRFLLSKRFRIGPGENPEDKYVNNLFVSTNVARSVLGKRYKKVIKARDNIREKGKPKSVKLKTTVAISQDKRTRQLIGSNVLGFIEGSDPDLKDEVVIVTAHYDHLGKRGTSVYNGADDNASGTSTVMEVAEALALAKETGNGPRRSVLCMLVSGEEKGLLGSKYYVQNPIFPLEQTVANVNVDMVGRVDASHAENPNYIYVIGADRLSTTLHEINEEANASYTQLELDYTYNEEDDPNRYYYRSDHYNFAEQGIPAIFYFNGTHEDYHRPSDTIDKINFEKMAKIGQLVFHVVWELANRPERIQVDVKE